MKKKITILTLIVATSINLQAARSTGSTTNPGTGGSLLATPPNGSTNSNPTGTSNSESSSLGASNLSAPLDSRDSSLGTMKTTSSTESSLGTTKSTNTSDSSLGTVKNTSTTINQSLGTTKSLTY